MNQICEGSFAKVYCSYTKPDREIRAIKVIETSKDKSEKDGIKIAWLAQEIEITRRVSHPNIVTLYEIIKTGTTVNFVYEMMDCDLWEFLNELRRDSMWITERHVVFTMKSLLEVVAYLHSHDIVHRDIKPENLLIQKCNGIVKLTDFGIAKVVVGSASATPFGSRSYMAPEILSGTRKGILQMNHTEIPKVPTTKEGVKRMDLWSCGIVLYFLLIGSFPPIVGKTKEDLLPFMKKPEAWDFHVFPEVHDKKWKTVSPEGRKLVSLLLSLDPSDRPTAESALQHRFISRLDTGSVGPLQAPDNSTDKVNIKELQV